MLADGDGYRVWYQFGIQYTHAYAYLATTARKIHRWQVSWNLC